LISVLT